MTNCSLDQFGVLSSGLKAAMHRGLRYLRGLAALAIAGVLVAGCQTQTVNPTAPPVFSTEANRVLLMPVDVQLYELLVSGLEEPRADWTSAAEVHVRKAIDIENTERNLQLIRFETEAVPADKQPEVYQIIRLHEAVGASMLQHRHIPGLRLPTKTSEFDWTMGHEVALLRDLTGADYALFIYLRDSYSSGGRVALNILTAVLFGYAQGGAQIGYATLVDLRTGNVAWFGSLARSSGDLRTEAAAADAVNDLFEGLPGS